MKLSMGYTAQRWYMKSRNLGSQFKTHKRGKKPQNNLLKKFRAKFPLQLLCILMLLTILLVFKLLRPEQVERNQGAYLTAQNAHICVHAFIFMHPQELDTHIFSGDKKQTPDQIQYLQQPILSFTTLIHPILRKPQGTLHLKEYQTGPKFQQIRRLNRLQNILC